MKKLLMISFALLYMLSINAQNTRHQTLFNNTSVVGAFAGPIYEFGFDKSDIIEYSVGGGVGLVIDNFFVGAYGLGSTSLSNIIEEGRADISLGHGGFWLGYSLSPFRVVHFTTSAKLGWGLLDIEIDDDDFDFSDQVFVTTPEVGVELNIFKIFRIAGAVGYRFVSGVDDNIQYKKDAFNNLTGSVTLKIGWFGNANRVKHRRNKSHNNNQNENNNENN